jgi:hypothetical protein
VGGAGGSAARRGGAVAPLAGRGRTCSGPVTNGGGGEARQVRKGGVGRGGGSRAGGVAARSCRRGLVDEAARVVAGMKMDATRW